MAFNDAGLMNHLEDDEMRHDAEVAANQPINPPPSPALSYFFF